MSAFWTDCIHHGAHYVDVSWKGAEALAVAFLFGLWLGWRPRRRELPVEKRRDEVGEKSE